MEQLESFPKIGAPATRALNAAGYAQLHQVANASRSELAALHGVGPRAIHILEASLEEHGLGLAD